MPSTEVTPDVDVTADVTTDSEAHAGCPACRHELAAHDALGRRFCAATLAGTQERGCICASSAPVTSR